MLKSSWESLGTRIGFLSAWSPCKDTAEVPPNCGHQDSKDEQTRRYKMNYSKHFPELPNNVLSSGSFVACNHESIRAIQDSLRDC